MIYEKDVDELRIYYKFDSEKNPYVHEIDVWFESIQEYVELKDLGCDLWEKITAKAQDFINDESPIDFSKERIK